MVPGRSPMPCPVPCLPWVPALKCGRHLNSEGQVWVSWHGHRVLKHVRAPELLRTVPDMHLDQVLTTAHVSLVLSGIPLSEHWFYPPVICRRTSWITIL